MFSTDPDMKLFFNHMRGIPEGWHETKFMPEKKRSLQNSTQCTVKDPERDAKFGECFGYLSENFPPEDWTVVEDDFVFKHESDAAYFVMNFCI